MGIYQLAQSSPAAHLIFLIEPIGDALIAVTLIVLVFAFIHRVLTKI